MIQETDVVAILNSSAGRTAIWHVDINPVTPLGRLCGAWVVDDPNVWRGVLATRLLLPIRDLYDEALDDAVALTVGTLDSGATRGRVVEAMNDLAEAWLAIETARTSREHLAAGDTMVRPFPVVPTEPAKL